MSDFLSLPLDERRLAFGEAAQRLQVSPVMLEKDFWVCWLLERLFSDVFPGGDAANLVFKGGTSLSKVFGVIDRFSEDIDLGLPPQLIGIDETMFETLPSRTRRDAAIRDMQEKCLHYTRDQLAPRLEQAIRSRLGKPPAGARWLEFEEDTASRSPVLLFQYPGVLASGFDYLKRTVKLEPGSLTDQRPLGVHPVKPWIADAFPAAFTDWKCDVVALELERTFWEKATILHAEFHRPAASVMPDRYARHYADMASLLRHPAGLQNLMNAALAERVVEWKGKYFARNWARYDLARPGSFRLVPPPARIAPLQADYQRMRPMFVSEPPSFQALLDQLADAERLLNQT